MPDLLHQERFRSRADRVERNEELVGLFAPRVRTATTGHWVAVLDDVGVPCGPVRERDELFDDDQVRAMGMLIEVDDDELGSVTMTAPVVRLSRTPGAIRFAGRHLGADTRAVLEELGYPDDEVARLEAAGWSSRADGAAGHDNSVIWCRSLGRWSLYWQTGVHGRTLTHPRTRIGSPPGRRSP